MTDLAQIRSVLDGADGSLSTRAREHAQTLPNEAGDQRQTWSPSFRRVPPALSLDDVFDLASQDAWLVRGLLDRDAVAMLYGASGSYKTFVALDLAIRLALGRDVWGRQARRAKVGYFIGEAQRSTAKRIVGWLEGTADRHELDGNFRLVTNTPDLLAEASVAQAIETCAADGFMGDEDTPGLIVVDTLSTAIAGGDGNADAVASLAVESLKRIGRGLNAAVVAVHHSRKDGTTERGSGALRANVDGVFRVEGSTKQMRATVTCDKSRDEPPGPVTLQLQQVAIRGLTSAPTTLRVLGPADQNAPQTRQKWAGLLATSPLKRAKNAPSPAEAAVADALLDLGEATRAQLAEAVTDYDKTTVRKCLNSLRKGGWVIPEANARTCHGTLFHLQTEVQEHIEKLRHMAETRHAG